MWEVSAERARQLIFLHEVVPAHALAGGRRVVSRADVQRVAELAGSPGEVGRWWAAKAAARASSAADPSAADLPAPWRPGRPGRQAQMIAGLPWADLVEEYRTGAATAAEIAARYRIGVRTVRKRLRAHGGDLLGRYGAPRAVLPVTDEELATRYADGATLAELAWEYQVSSSLIWRRVHFRDKTRG